MSEFISRDQKIADLEKQVREMTARLERLENPKKNTGSAPRPVHSPPREMPPPPSKEQIIADMKKYKVR